MNKYLIIALCAAIGGALLTGCGSSGNTQKLKKKAEQYVTEKYGFHAKAGRVSLDGLSWLDPIWEKSKQGIVEMDYEGKIFYVHATLEGSADACADNYMEDEWCSRISSYFEDKIVCDDQEINVAYTVGFYKHMVGKDILTYEDMIRDMGPVNVYMNTYGLDPSCLSAIDMTQVPDVGGFYIYDWNDPADVHTKSEVTDSPRLERTHLRAFSSFDENGHVFEQYAADKKEIMTVSYIDDGTFVISDAAETPASPYNGATSWYDLRNTGTEDLYVYLLIPVSALDETQGCCLEYTKNGELQAPVHLQKNSANFDEEMYFIYHEIPAGETETVRIITED
jgi:hypothetical protein